MRAIAGRRRWLAVASLLLAATAAFAPIAASAGDRPPRGSHPSFATGEGPPTDPPPCPDASPTPTCECGGATAPGSKPVNAIGAGETHEKADLVLPGVFPIELKRRYDSRSRYDSPLGYGWSWSYDLRLYEYPDDSVVVRESCGYRRRFTATGGGYVAEGVRQEELQAHGDGTWTMISPRGKRAHFDLEGRLTSLEDPHGNELVFSYTPTKKDLTGTAPTAVDPSAPMVAAQLYQLTRMDEVLAASGPSGRFVTLSYAATTGRLTQVQASDGRTVTYVHDTHAGATRGNLVLVNGLEGIVSSYGYADPNDDHNLTSVQEGQGATAWTLQYDDQDRVVQQARGDRVLGFDYTTPLRTVVTRTRKDHLGNALPAAVEAYEYTPSGHLVKKVDALGNELRYGLDAQNFRTREELWWNTGTLVSPTLVLQKATDRGYDLDGNLVSRTVALDGPAAETVTETWSYDHHWVASYQVVSSAAPSKVFRTEYTFTRDSEGRPVNVQQIRRRRDDGSFQTTLLGYDANGQLAVITPPAVVPADGLQIRRLYYAPPEASPGLLKEERVELGGTPDPHLKRSFAYDGAGFVSQVTNARGHVTTYATDDLGRVISITNPLGEATLYTYAGTTLGVAPGSWTPGANLAEVEVGRTAAEGEGQVRRQRFDAEGRLRQVERKDDAGTFATFMTYAYDSDDNRTRETDALARTTSHAHDALRRLTSTTDAAVSPNTAAYAYDAAGNRVLVTDALGRKTVFVYDDLDRLLESEAQGSPSQPLSPPLETRFAHDAAGNVTKVRDPKNHDTTYSYSALSELTAVTQPLGQTVGYTYDPRGRLARVTNARGHALQHLYEPWGGLQAVRHYPTAADADAGTNLGRTISYGYDASGNVTSTGDTDFNPTSPTLETTTYDALDRPDVVTVQFVPGGNRTLESGYDRFGNRSSLVFTDGPDVLSHSWTYNDLNRLVTAQLASPGPLAFGYYANDDLEQVTHGNGVTTEYTYRPEGPVETITTESTTAQLLRLSYTVNKVLNITGLTEQHAAGGPSHVYGYGYDALDRLTSATYPTELGLPAAEAFAYDPAGNREEPSNPSTYDYDANNRILASPGKAWVYDPDGNPLSVNAGQGSEETFTYDSANRLREYTNAATGVSASYLYDPSARRLRKTANGSTTWVLWDGDRLLAEFDGSGDRTRRYTYTAGYAPAEQAVSTGPTSESVQQVHADHLETPRSLSGSSGAAVWRAAYLAFGATTPNEDPDADLTSVSLGVRFPGQFGDAESSLSYNVARNYDPKLGRYRERDPIADELWLNFARESGPGTQSPSVIEDAPAAVPLAFGNDEWIAESLYVPLLDGYSYALQNPTSVVDPDGEAPHRKRRGSKKRTNDRHTKPRPGGAEKGDARRDPPRRPPPGYKGGPWPPPPRLPLYWPPMFIPPPGSPMWCAMFPWDPVCTNPPPVCMGKEPRRKELRSGGTDRIGGDVHGEEEAVSSWLNEGLASHRKGSQGNGGGGVAHRTWSVVRAEGQKASSDDQPGCEGWQRQGTIRSRAALPFGTARLADDRASQGPTRSRSFNGEQARAA